MDEEIKQGECYRCIKNVIMDDPYDETRNGKPCYVKGNVYESERDKCLTDEFGDKNHVWPIDGKFSRHFKKVGTVEPVRPCDMVQVIPEWVIEGANECIKKNWVELNGKSVFTQNDLLKCIMKYAPKGMSRQVIFDRHWLDIEPVYRKAGWHVEYDAPSYYETYEATFTFKSK